MKYEYIICENKAERDAVLRKLEKNGYIWANGESLTEWNMEDAWGDKSISLSLDKEQMVRWIFTRTEQREHPRAVSAQNYLYKYKPILITRKGRVVTAENKNTGEKAIATCCPTDTFDFGTGAMIAVARLIAQSDKGITKDAETVLRQLLGDDVSSDSPADEWPTSKFKIGDIVTLKDGLEVGKPYGAVDLLEIMYSNGHNKRMKVVDTIKCEDGDMAYDCAPISGGRSFWYVEEMLEPWDENKIREGDIVKVINTGLNYSTYPQWVGEHISDPDMAARYCFGSPSTDGNYRVIKIAEHESNGRTLAYIEQCDGFIFNKCYLVEVKGLEKVTEE